MNGNTNLRTPLKRARGLGSAKTGTGHFLAQRVTAVALVLLALYALVLIVSLADADYGRVRATVAQPLNATLLVAFLACAFWHAKLGMQVIIEDYVHTPAAAMALQLLNLFACAIAGVASIIAVLRITFAGA